MHVCLAKVLNTMPWLFALDSPLNKLKKTLPCQSVVSEIIFVHTYITCERVRRDRSRPGFNHLVSVFLYTPNEGKSLLWFDPPLVSLLGCQDWIRILVHLLKVATSRETVSD